MASKTILVGNLGKDPEAIGTSGMVVFSLATSEKWKDKDTGEKQERTSWHNIVTFGKLADICQAYLKKGKKVYIEGRIQYRDYEDNDGNKRKSTEIVASQMEMLDSKGDSQPDNDDIDF